MKLRLKKFQPEEMLPHRTILLLGKRGTGKSILLEDLLYHMHSNLDMVVAMTPTQDSREMFEKHVPGGFIHDKFNSAAVDSLCATQRAAAKKRKTLRNVCLVLDDMAADKRVLKCPAIRDIYLNGRHQHITYINTQQYCMDLPPDLRANVDYVFTLKETILANKQRLHKYFFGCFPNLQDFCSVMDRVTSDFGVLVLDNTKRGTDITDLISWYRADPHLPAFRMGRPIFWALDAATAKSEEDIESDARARQAQPSNNRRGGIVAIEQLDEAGAVVPQRDDLELV